MDGGPVIIAFLYRKRPRDEISPSEMGYSLPMAASGKLLKFNMAADWEQSPDVVDEQASCQKFFSSSYCISPGRRCTAGPC